MNTEIRQQEVMLVMGTSFSKKQLSARDNRNYGRDLSESETLEKACWDGLLDQLIPEIISVKRLRVWQIWGTATSLQIELSRYPGNEKLSSINPDYFLKAVKLN